MKRNTLEDLLRALVENDKERVLCAIHRAAAAAAAAGNDSESTMLLGHAERIRRVRHAQAKELTLLAPSYRRASLDCFESRPAQRKLHDVILPAATRAELDSVICEYQKMEMLRGHGLSPKKKLLFFGPSGTGKTMTGETIAEALNLPFYVLHVARLIESHFGNTLKNLDASFAGMEETPGVFLFDEFDAVASVRGASTDVGEMNRTVNGLLVQMDFFHGDSILIACTNRPTSLDPAFRRRFDSICYFPEPTRAQRSSLILSTVGRYKFALSDDELYRALEITNDLTFHETESLVLTCIKEAVMSESKKLLIDQKSLMVKHRLDSFK